MARSLLVLISVISVLLASVWRCSATEPAPPTAPLGGGVAPAVGVESGPLVPADVAPVPERTEASPRQEDRLTLSGRVIDQDGSPLTGATVIADLGIGHDDLKTKSGADGSFVLFLEEDRGHRLRVGLFRYTFRGRGKEYRPGVSGIELVLVREEMARFLVLDGATGEPVEFFGLLIRRGAGQKALEKTRGMYLSTGGHPVNFSERHPGGEVEENGRAGYDRWKVDAPGYLSCGGEIVHETPDSNRQVIRLRRGARVSGRVLRDGAPVEHARLRLDRLMWEHERVSFGKVSFGVPGPKSWEVLEAGRREPKQAFKSVDRRSVTASTGADGRFHILGLRGDTYRLDIFTGEGDSVRVESFELASHQQEALGDLHLGPSATITGRLLMPAGRSPEGLGVFLGECPCGPGVEADAEGWFRFENVVPGEHRVGTRFVNGRYAPSEPVMVRIGVGETRDVLLDLRRCELCKLSLRVELGSAPPSSLQDRLIPGAFPSGLKVRLIPVASPWQRYELGSVEPGGSLSRWTRAVGDVHVEVLTRTGVVLRNPSAAVSLECGTTPEEQIRFAAADLELTFTAPLVLPEDGLIRLELVPRAASPELRGQALRIPYHDRRAPSLADLRFDGRSGSVRIAYVPVGEYGITFELAAWRISEEEPNRFDSSDEHFESPPVFRRSGTVILRDGETTELAW